jgi:hypothetical protein
MSRTSRTGGLYGQLMVVGTPVRRMDQLWYDTQTASNYPRMTELYRQRNAPKLVFRAGLKQKNGPWKEPLAVRLREGRPWEA